MATPSPAASSYAAKLKDPRWQKKRLECLDAARWQCQSCGDGTSTLHVHHKRYIKGREPWEYDRDQLAVLCECCHDEQHAMPDVLMDVISRLDLDGPAGRESVAHLIAGFVGQQLEAEFPGQKQIQMAGAAAYVWAYGQKVED
jgi:hypothetical protein